MPGRLPGMRPINREEQDAEQERLWSQEDAGRPMGGAAVDPLAGLTLVVEHPEYFEVRQGDQTYPVLKEGLEKDTLAHLQGLAHAYEISAPVGPGPGGTTVGPRDLAPAADQPIPAATPMDVPSDAPPVLPAPTPMVPRPMIQGEEIPQYAAGGQVTDAGFGQTQFAPLGGFGGVDAGSGLPLAPSPSGQVDPTLAALPEAHWLRTGGAALARGAMGVLADPTQALGAIADSPLGPLLSTTGAGPILELVRAGRGAVSAAESATNPPLPSATLPMLGDPGPARELGRPGAGGSPPPNLPGVPSQVGELNKGLEEQRAGLQAQAKVEAERDAATMALADQQLAKMQALEMEHAESQELHQRRADDLFQATLNARIQPNRIWANADMGQRIGAGIGILLSGIGSGLAGGPNLALQQIDKTIDRDIAAQRDNLETQKGLLGHYLQQGRDMLQAHQLAKADLKDMFAAQMVRVSAQFGGPEAAARAQLMMGQLRSDAAMKRSEVLGRDFAIKKERLAMSMEMERARLLSQFAAQLDTGQVSPSMWEMAPGARERRVHLPSGKWALASDASQARTVTEGLRVANELSSNLKRYRTLHESGHPRWWASIGGDEASAEQGYGTLTAKLKDMEKLGAISKGDYELIEKQIPDISSWRSGDAAINQKLDALGYSIQDAVDSQLRVLGIQ